MNDLQVWLEETWGKIRFDRGEYIDRSEIEVIDLDLGRYGEQQREPSIAGDWRKRNRTNAPDVWLVYG